MEVYRTERKIYTSIINEEDQLEDEHKEVKEEEKEESPEQPDEETAKVVEINEEGKNPRLE